MKPNGKSAEVRAFLEEGCELQGTLNFTGVVRINGRFTGEIYSQDALIIGSSAQINGMLKVGSAIIGGRVEGTITATERLEIQSGAKVLAGIEAPVLVIHEGAQILGEVRVIRDMKTNPKGLPAKPEALSAAPQAG